MLRLYMFKSLSNRQLELACLFAEETFHLSTCKFLKELGENIQQKNDTFFNWKKSQLMCHNPCNKSSKFFLKVPCNFACLLHGSHAKDMQHLITCSLMQILKAIQDTNLNDLNGHNFVS